MCRLNMTLAEYMEIVEEAEAKLPTCDCCGDPIYGDRYWELEPWRMYCEDCKDKFIDARERKIAE